MGYFPCCCNETPCLDDDSVVCCGEGENEYQFSVIYDIDPNGIFGIECHCARVRSCCPACHQMTLAGLSNTAFNQVYAMNGVGCGVLNSYQATGGVVARIATPGGAFWADATYWSIRFEYGGSSVVAYKSTASPAETCCPRSFSNVNPGFNFLGISGWPSSVSVVPIECTPEWVQSVYPAGTCR